MTVRPVFARSHPLQFIGPIAEHDLMLPIVGTRICAGFPSPADDFLDEEIDLSAILRPNPAASFLWRVRGSSMIEVGIHDGDLIVVDRSATPKDGDVVVCTINGENSLKLFEDRGRARLAFANSDMPAFAIDEAAEIEIWGVATWSLHKPRRR